MYFVMNRYTVTNSKPHNKHIHIYGPEKKKHIYIYDYIIKKKETKTDT